MGVETELSWTFPAPGGTFLVGLANAFSKVAIRDKRQRPLVPYSCHRRRNRTFTRHFLTSVGRFLAGANAFLLLFSLFPGCHRRQPGTLGTFVRPSGRFLMDANSFQDLFGDSGDKQQCPLVIMTVETALRDVSRVCRKVFGRAQTPYKVCLDRRRQTMSLCPLVFMGANRNIILDIPFAR